MSAKFLRLENLAEKTLIGISMEMSLAEDKTPLLWRSFMPRRNEILFPKNKKFYSLQKYYRANDFFQLQKQPTILFTKWAAVEVEKNSPVPDSMEQYHLEEGWYAVFLHKGLPQDFPETYQFIMQDWLPGSGYEIDHRNHFELIPENYRPTDPEAEEEIWLPVRKKEH